MKTLLIWVCTMAALTAQCQCDLKESVLSQDSNLPTSRLLRRHNSQHSSRQAHHHPGLLNRSTALNSEAIYWVNLDAAEHRRVGMIRRIRFYGYRSIRVPAYDKEAISLQHLAVIPECLVKQHVPCRGSACPMGLINLQPKPGVELRDIAHVIQLCSRPVNTPVELACSLSHLRAIRWAVGIDQDKV